MEHYDVPCPNCQVIVGFDVKPGARGVVTCPSCKAVIYATHTIKRSDPSPTPKAPKIVRKATPVPSRSVVAADDAIGKAVSLSDDEAARAKRLLDW